MPTPEQVNALVMTAVAGCATSIGAASVFLPGVASNNGPNKMLLAGVLALSAGVMTQVSYTELWNEAEEGLRHTYDRQTAKGVAALCFFSGFACVRLLDDFVDWLLARQARASPQHAAHASNTAWRAARHKRDGSLVPLPCALPLYFCFAIGHAVQAWWGDVIAEARATPVVVSPPASPARPREERAGLLTPEAHERGAGALADERASPTGFGGGGGKPTAGGGSAADGDNAGTGLPGTSQLGADAADDTPRVVAQIAAVAAELELAAHPHGHHPHAGQAGAESPQGRVATARSEKLRSDSSDELAAGVGAGHDVVVVAGGSARSAGSAGSAVRRASLAAGTLGRPALDAAAGALAHGSQGQGLGHSHGGAEAAAHGGGLPPLAHDHHAEMAHVSMVTGLALFAHNIPEGIATYIGALGGGPGVGVTLTLAIGLHNAFEGIAVALPVYFATGSRWRAFMWASLAGIAEPLSALVVFGCMTDTPSPTVLGAVFGIVAGIMTSVALLELLTTARDYDPRGLIVGKCFVLGLAVMTASLVSLA